MAQKKETIAEDVSIISSGVKIEGNLFSLGNVRIDGSVLGNVTVNGNFTIGDGSELNGEIEATNITMSGKIIGKVNAHEKLKLESKCYLEWNFVATFSAHIHGLSSVEMIILI